MKTVTGKVAFITGGGSGIGLGMARAFHAAGMKVVIADLDQQHLDAAMAHFRAQPHTVHAIKLDVTDREAMARAADEAERVFGKVHVLCNNAGVGVFGSLLEASYDDWDWALSVNLGGAINGVQTFLPRMLAHGEGGHIVTTSSMSGLLACIGGIYITTKYALVGYMETLRLELASARYRRVRIVSGPGQHGDLRGRELTAGTLSQHPLPGARQRRARRCHARAGPADRDGSHGDWPARAPGDPAQ